MSRFLPEDRIFRLDSDVAVSRNRARHPPHLARSAPGVLLGSQMVAKGHDFPGRFGGGGGCRLSASISPTSEQPSERSSCSVRCAGGQGAEVHRVGRWCRPGIPIRRALGMAVQGEERAFYRRVDERRRLGFPPATMLVRVVLAGKGARMDGAARLVMDSLVGWAGEQRAAVGPNTATAHSGSANAGRCCGGVAPRRMHPVAAAGAPVQLTRRTPSPRGRSYGGR